MSFIHDIIKRQYVYEGYLPNYPYHLISDKEMFDAFIFNENNYFDNYYPRSLFSDSELSLYYDNLKDEMISYINNYISDNSNILPNWVYSYMLGVVISINSDKRDVHDLLIMLGEDNLDDDFTVEAAAKCYGLSKDWETKLSRQPTVFGEPLIIKSLRLNPLYQ